MSPEDEILSTEACRRLLTEYAIAVDHGDAESLVPQFVEDGTHVRRNDRLRGRGQLPLILGKRPSQLVMRHHLTTMRFRVIDQNNAEGYSYYLLYRGEGDEKPLPLDPPFSAGDWHSRFVRTAMGWKLARLEVKRLFVQSAQAEGNRRGQA
jgi:hypothetical protein